jgi:plastocyanin
MKKFAALAITLFLISAFAVAGCGKTQGGGGTTTGGGTSQTISMDANNFTTHSITVKANQPVHFDNTVNGGGYHIVCIGTGNGGTNTCSAAGSGQGPSELYGEGVTFNGGDKKDITFTTPGTYHVICTVHSGMVIDVTVQ